MFPSFDSTAGSLTRRVLSSVAGRMLLGYLLVRLVTDWRAQAAPTTETTTTSAPIPTTTDMNGLCTARGLQEFLEQTENLTSEDIDLAYEHCRAQFLAENHLSPEVKQTVDDWIGTDLSKAETNQIFLAYELALMGPKPEHLPEAFAGECRRMVDQFQAFRDSLEPLISRVEIDLDALLASGSEEIEDAERELLNFVQYSQFCRSLLKRSSKDIEGMDTNQL